MTTLLFYPFLLFSDWGPETRLTYDSGYSGNRPSNRWIACDLSENVHIVWHDNRDGNFEIYGACIDPDLIKRISYNDSLSLCPSIASEFTPEEHIHVIWMDNRDGNFEIYYRCNYSIGVKETNTLQDYPSKKNINLQISPNPFIDNTTTSYSIAKPGKFSLKVYDITGRCIKTLIEQRKESGVYLVKWNGCDNTNRKVSTGVYFIRLSSGDFSSAKKVILVR